MFEYNGRFLLNIAFSILIGIIFSILTYFDFLPFIAFIIPYIGIAAFVILLMISLIVILGENFKSHHFCDYITKIFIAVFGTILSAALAVSTSSTILFYITVGLTFAFFVSSGLYFSIILNLVNRLND